MHYSIEMQAERCLIIVSTSGAATFAGFKSFIYELVNPPYSEVDYNVLVDLQQLDMNLLTSTNIERIVGIVEANKNKIIPVKIALVVNSKLSFGLSRMYEMLAVDKGPQTTRVFYSYDEAMAWLSADTP
jgi:hypothetical protein